MMDTLEKVQRLAHSLVDLEDNQAAEVGVKFLREIAYRMERDVARLRELDENIIELESQREISDNRTAALYAELKRWNLRLQKVQSHLVAVHLALELGDDRPTEPGEAHDG